MRVDIACDAPAWRQAIPDADTVVRQAIEAAAGRIARAISPGRAGGAVSVLLTSDERQRQLNREWRGHDRSTNVLSFPAGPLDDLPGAGPGAVPEAGDRELGDISLALGTLTAEATAEGIEARHHLAHLAVHGFLHLLGYDHEDETEAAEMEALETAILAEMGIDDPYALPQNQGGGGAPAPLEQ